QVEAVKRAGYEVRPSRVIEETISGATPAMDRPQFVKLVDKLEEGDCLVVTKIDRLGRDNIDVQKTVTMLLDMGVKLVCLDLPVKDLSSAEGKLILQLFSTFAEFELNRIRERTREGLERAKAQGRPVAVNTTEAVLEHKAKGLSQSQVAKLLNLSVRTVSRHWTKTL
ncbi:TPA: recombinase family protein, partial [Shigella dysenteriae]|nr:recombinase family protein [Shigella dysenteriae]EKH9110333.1 recombinase family protein [Shigella dysenteriae]HCR7045634.1 recombinase family protein [Shigella dysenteriae]